jgi:hypothetical protein
MRPPHMPLCDVTGKVPVYFLPLTVHYRWLDKFAPFLFLFFSDDGEDEKNLGYINSWFPCDLKSFNRNHGASPSFSFLFQLANNCLLHS